MDMFWREMESICSLQAQVTMDAMYLMVAAVAKDSTTAIIMSSPFMNLDVEFFERKNH